MKNFQPLPDPEDLVFVDLLSDAGFKLVYANPANKSLLINLLNIVLPEFVRVSGIPGSRADPGKHLQQEDNS